MKSEHGVFRIKNKYKTNYLKNEINDEIFHVFHAVLGYARGLQNLNIYCDVHPWAIFLGNT